MVTSSAASFLVCASTWRRSCDVRHYTAERGLERPDADEAEDEEFAVNGQSRTEKAATIAARALVGLFCVAAATASLTVFDLPQSDRGLTHDDSADVVTVQLTSLQMTRPRRLTHEWITDGHAQMGRFAVAVSQPRLGEEGPDELRILISWADFGETPTGVSMLGFIVHGDEIVRCPVAYGASLQDPLKGYCARPTRLNAGSPLANWRAFVGLAGYEYQCGWVDGYWVTIEGRRNGQVFLLEASNPDQCSDIGSQIVSNLLDGLPGSS